MLIIVMSNVAKNPKLATNFNSNGRTFSVAKFATLYDPDGDRLFVSLFSAAIVGINKLFDLAISADYLILMQNKND